MSDTLNLIKNSFENWYNTTNKSNLSMVINYSDEQTLRLKAYHKVTINMIAVGIKDNLSYTLPVLSISEHYNHGTTTEEEAKALLTQKFLMKVFLYCSSK